MDPLLSMSGRPSRRGILIRAGLGLMASLSVPACAHLDGWTADELAEWCRTTGGGAPLYYRGSDGTHHHFHCRPVDAWVAFRVPREELLLEDEEPLATSSADPFPGYYAVDPGRGFVRIEEGRAGGSR